MDISKNEIQEVAFRWAAGMSEDQINNFVMKSHVTHDRQVKQALLEIEQRSHNLLKIEIDHKKTLLNIKRLEKKLQECDDELDKEAILLDLESEKLDDKAWIRRKKGLYRELDSFYKYIQNLGLSKEDLEEHLNYDPEQERKYWIARLGKQAALDMISSGRIGIGNMDSIAMLTEEDQIAIMQVAVQYSGLLSVGMQKMQQKLVPHLQELEKIDGFTLPTFHGIEDNLEIPLLQKLKEVKGELNESKENIQSSDKSEAG